MGSNLAGEVPFAATTATPEPTPAEFDPNLVTPGVVGFIATAIFIIAVVFLAVDMGRRMRRVRYREEARRRIAAELEEQTGLAEPSTARPDGADGDGADEDEAPAPRE